MLPDRMEPSLQVPRESRIRRALIPSLLLAFGLVVGLGIAELALRLIGFEFSRYPVVQFGWPDPVTLRTQYRSDPVLFWVQKDYDARLADARALKPAVVFLGDSCTEFGAYPGMTLKLLAERRPELARGVPLGVGGWSSEQGKRQLQRDVLPLQPRVVTIFFGWNDHWMALGPPDANIRPPLLPAPWSDWSRMAQLIDKVWLGKQAASSRRPNRVSPAHYEENIAEMIDMLHGSRIEAVLITAPSNHVAGHEPEYLLQRHVRRLEDLVPLHREYVELTRAAGKTGGAPVCDAAAAFAALPPPADRYFKRDGIHLTQEGDRALATLLAGCLDRAVPPNGS
jgi:lysophospholipase L1-like esterase